MSWRVGTKVPLNVYDEHGDPVCQAHTPERARLIAAAPDLLEACKWFVSQLQTGTIVRDITKDAQSDWDIWAMRTMHFTVDLRKAVSAVAKAEGA